MEEATGARVPRAPAPNLCGGRVGDSHAHCVSYADSVVHDAYAEWGEHHNSCLVCGRHDWYMPGTVLIHVDPLLAVGTFRLSRNGHVEEVTYRRGYDPNVLCSLGTSLFQQWVRSTMGSPMKVRTPKRYKVRGR